MSTNEEPEPIILTTELLERIEEIAEKAGSVLPWEQGDYIPGNPTAGEISLIARGFLSLLEQFADQIPVSVSPISVREEGE